MIMNPLVDVAFNHITKKEEKNKYYRKKVIYFFSLHCYCTSKRRRTKQYKYKEEKRNILSIVNVAI